tara:strand:- start:190 stop:426 length:237 start_codon:yes stop_codon:yes gene_type:complete
MIKHQKFFNQADVVNAYKLARKTTEMQCTFEQGFQERAYKNGDLSAYFDRLNGIGFKNLDLILDAGDEGKPVTIKYKN